MSTLSVNNLLGIKNLQKQDINLILKQLIILRILIDPLEKCLL